MNTVTLQVPISKKVRDEAANVAKDYGFSSLQEIIRVLLTKLSKRELSFTVSEEEEFVELSPAAAKRYAKMKEDFRLNRNVYHAKDVDDFLKQLHEN